MLGSCVTLAALLAVLVKDRAKDKIVVPQRTHLSNIDVLRRYVYFEVPRDNKQK